MRKTREKRTTPRIGPYVVPCLLIIIEAKRGLPGFLTDLSTRGGRALCEAAAPGPGARVALEFRIGKRVQPSRVLAAVQWVRRAAKGMRAVGLRFERMAAEDRKALEALVQEFRRRVAELGQA
jgi:hypothetical protein